MGIKDLYDSEADESSESDSEEEPLELEVTGLGMLASGETPQDMAHFKHQKKNEYLTTVLK